MADNLTAAELRCCHMRAQEFDYSTTTIEQWRAEFRGIARSEHCRDCPVFKGAVNAG
jgi:hypothetical protein